MAFITYDIPLTGNRTATLGAGWGKAVVEMVHAGVTRQFGKAEIGQLSDHYLRDIGLTRHDVTCACADLLSDRDVQLSEIATSRAGNW